MITASTEEGRRLPDSLYYVETEHLGVEADGPLKLRDLEVHVAHDRLSRDRGEFALVAHGYPNLYGVGSTTTEQNAMASRSTLLERSSLAP